MQYSGSFQKVKEIFATLKASSSTVGFLSPTWHNVRLQDMSTLQTVSFCSCPSVLLNKVEQESEVVWQ